MNLTQNEIKVLDQIIQNFDLDQFYWSGRQDYLDRCELFNTIEISNYNNLTELQKEMIGQVLNCYYLEEDTMWGDLDDDEWEVTHDTYMNLCSMFKPTHKLGLDSPTI